MHVRDIFSSVAFGARCSIGLNAAPSSPSLIRPEKASTVLLLVFAVRAAMSKGLDGALEASETLMQVSGMQLKLSSPGSYPEALDTPSPPLPGRIC